MLFRSKKCASTAIGTQYYAAPEVLKAKTYKDSVDIWSVGCIIHELCVLTQPYIGINEYQQVELIERNPYNKNSISKEYSDELKNIVKSMLIIQPEERSSYEQILGNILISTVI